MKRIKTKIIDASNSAQIIYLTASEGQNTHIICQGLEQVDIYLPSKSYFPYNTDPIIISRDKINQSVFIHTSDARFQNQFDVEMRTISLDLYYSKTLRLIKEDRNISEWYVISNGQQGYSERSITAEIYGTSFAVTGTQDAYFFEGNYQTSATATNSPSLRSYLYDHGFADSKISTARNEVHFLKPGLYEREYNFNLVSESTETSSLRLRLRQLNDLTFDESAYDVYFITGPGTNVHSINMKASMSLLGNVYATHTAYNTSGEPYDKVVYRYDIVVDGNGTWFFTHDLISNSNANWINRIKYTLLGDPDLQAAVANRTSFE